MGLTNLSAIPPVIATYYDRNLLERALPALVHDRFGQKRPIKKNSGNQIIFRRYESLTAATTPLTEGTTPSGSALSKTDVTATLAQYGDFVTITDMVELTNQDPVLTEAGAVLGEQMGNTLDRIYRAVLVAGTSVFYANAVAGRSNIVTKIAAADFDKIVRALRRNNAKYWSPEIKASTGVGTAPVRAAYFAIVHPDTAYDLEAVLTTSFKPVSEYASMSGVMEDEIGTYKNIRFIMSTNANIVPDTGGTAVTNGLKYTTANTSCDVYQTLIFGKDAYGVCPLDALTSKMIIKPRGSSGAYDPLDQFGTVGWKATTVAKILNNSFMYRYEHGVSA